MKKPLYRVSDTVVFRDKYKDVHEGEIVEIEKSYLEVDKSGRFDKNGLLTIEHSISCMSVPYELNGETLKVFIPEQKIGNYVSKPYVRESRFYGYCYTIEAYVEDFGREIKIIVSEEQIIK